jgi:predicted lipoprotein with Yx(FWY)xxD motif
MHARTMLRSAALLAAGTLALAACGAGKSSTTHASAAAATPAASTSPASAPASPATVKVSVASIGSVLVSADGMTLYRFDKDKGTGSNCNGACAQTWPPLLVSGTPTGSPDLGGALGVISRADGTTQVTYQGHPLYHFAADRQPGDTKGDGFGGIWHAVRPAGTPTAVTTPTTAASPSYGY